MPTDLKIRRKAGQALKTTGKLSVRTVRSNVRITARQLKASRNHSTARQETSGEEYAADRVVGAEKTTFRAMDRRGRRAAKSSVKMIRRARHEKAERKNALVNTGGTANSRRGARRDAAARRETVKKIAARQAQEQKTRTFRDMFRAAKNAVRLLVKAVRKIVAGITLILGGTWIFVMLLIVIAVFGTFLAFLYTPEASDIEYVEAGPAVYYFLRTEVGLNSAAACGVMANIEVESSFRPDALGDSGTSYGLCQWHLSRWDRLNNYCFENGFSPASLAGQLQYLKWELETYYPALLELLKNVDDDVGGCYDAAYNFCVLFERPSDAEYKGGERASNALQTYWPYYGLNEHSGLWTEQGMALALTAYNELLNDGEKYWTWYGFDSHVEWCAIFVSWCAAQRGYIAEGIMPLCSSVDSQANGYAWYYSHGESFAASPDITPAPGWIAFFKRGHTGIVYSYTDEYVYLIERSTGDVVRLNEYPLDTVGEILWWSVPPYTY